VIEIRNVATLDADKFARESMEISKDKVHWQPSNVLQLLVNDNNSVKVSERMEEEIYRHNSNSYCNNSNNNNNYLVNRLWSILAAVVAAFLYEMPTEALWFAVLDREISLVRPASLAHSIIRYAH
jgi:hypothetical protein